VTLVLVLGMLSAFGPLAVDMYLPAFPAIGRDLGASPSAVGWTLAVYFAGLSLGQLVIGPLSDRIGRLRPLRAGLVLFLAGSAGAALAPGSELLIAARAVQALGGAACAVTSRAVVRDLYRGGEAARMNSRLVLVMGAAPMLAPLAGGVLLDVAGWRSIFAVLVGAAALALVVTTVALSETAPAYVTVSRGTNVRALVGDRGFVGHALVAASAQSGMFAYITGSPAVFITHHHVSPGHFGWFFGSNALAYIAMSQVNARLVRTRRPASLLAVGLVGLCAAAVALIAISRADLGLWPTAAAFSRRWRAWGSSCRTRSRSRSRIRASAPAPPRPGSARCRSPPPPARRRWSAHSATAPRARSRRSCSRSGSSPAPASRSRACVETRAPRRASDAAMSKHRPGRAWYLLGVVPLAVGAALFGHFLLETKHGVERMQRVVVPGEGDLRLEAGEYTGYGEVRSVVDGTAYRNDSFQLRCSLVDAESGAEVQLVAASSRTTYSMFGYQGESLFEVDIPRAGTYHLSCKGDDDLGVIAVGRGFFGAIIVMVLSVIGAVILFGVTMALVATWRGRAKRSFSPYPLPGAEAAVDRRG
jgi:DHA1 family bicyclomycin/chloramphenicol resistance-like MFS transporter